MRMQGIVLLGAFLKLTPYAKDSGMSDEEVYAGVEKALRKYFGKRGERVVQDNLEAVRRGYHEVMEVPREVMLSTGNPDRAPISQACEAFPIIRHHRLLEPLDPKVRVEAPLHQELSAAAVHEPLDPRQLALLPRFVGEEQHKHMRAIQLGLGKFGGDDRRCPQAP